MSKPTDVINLTGNYAASLAQLAKKLGTDVVRRDVFKNMYGKHRKPRSADQIRAAVGVDKKRMQQVRNALAYLEQHHFIEKVPNDGSVQDGSRSLYRKIDSLRGHVKEIIKLADDKEKREALEAKAIGATPIVDRPARISRRRLQKKKTLTVLFLTSNPTPSSNLRTGVEFSRVQEAIRRSRYRDNVKIEHRPAANIQTVIDGLNDIRPDILHYSGHSDEAGLVLDDQSIPKYVIEGEEDDFSQHTDYELIAKALGATDFPPKLLVLNSCYSSHALKSLSGLTSSTITMDLPVSDVAAAVFSPQLYSALASGQSLEKAFSQALIAVEVAIIEDIEIPKLHGDARAKSAKFV